MRIRILQQLNSAYGTFAAGHIAELPKDVGQAWIEAGVAERAVPLPAADPAPVASAADGEPPTSANDEPEPPVTPQPRRRPPSAGRHPSSHDGPTWRSDDPS